MREFNRGNTIGSLYHLKKHRLSAPSAPAGALGALRQPLIDILAYCLNPNHYHLLVKQKAENGISEFMKRIGAGYICYFNEKYSRTGALFQGKYKFKPIASTIDLMKVSVYINCNAEIHGIAKSADWIWSSYLDYIGLRQGTLCDKDEVLNEFTNIEPFLFYIIHQDPINSKICSAIPAAKFISVFIICRWQDWWKT